MVLTLRDVTDERHCRNIQANSSDQMHKLRTPNHHLGWLQVQTDATRALAEQWHRREILSDELQELDAAATAGVHDRRLRLAAHVTNLRLDALPGGREEVRSGTWPRGGKSA